MSKLTVRGAGLIGLIQDLSSADLPPEAFSDALNVRLLDGMAMQFLGHGEVYAGAPVIPYHVLQVNVAGVRYWMYAGAEKIYAVTGSGGSVVHTNLTRQTAGSDVNYTGAPNAWTSTTLSGIPIFNAGNATDVPQQWDLSLANRMTALSNWPASTYCKSMRAYKNQLVALNVTKGTDNYPYMVKWSHPADPGSVPVSWDETDPVYDAGEVDLAEGHDPIVDGLQLGGTFVVYKEGSVWRMDYAGGVFVQQFTKVVGTSGAMNRNCIAEVEIRGASMHTVLTGLDVIVHDGQSPRSVIDKQMRRELFRRIDATNYDRSFVVKNPFVNEVFICFPQAGSTIPDMALVWNYADDTTTFREIPDLHHAGYGPVEVGLSQPWSADGAAWDTDTTTWAGGEATPDRARVIMASNEQKLFLLDSSTDFGSEQPTAFLERRALPVGSPEQMKTVTSIRPRIYGSDGETLVVKVGGADDPYEDPTYDSEATFTIGETVSCDVFSTWRYPAVRFENTGGANRWRLDSYDVIWEPAGAW